MLTTEASQSLAKKETVQRHLQGLQTAQRHLQRRRRIQQVQEARREKVRQWERQFRLIPKARYRREGRHRPLVRQCRLVRIHRQKDRREIKIAGRF